MKLRPPQTEFSIDIEKRCCVGGHRVEPGQRVTVDAAQARGLLDCGRGRLVNRGDMRAMQRVERAALGRTDVETLRDAAAGNAPMWPG